MRFAVFILSVFLTGTSVHAASLNVTWNCSSDQFDTKVSYDTDGKLQFSPNVFDSLTNVQDSECIANFQRKVDAELTKFKTDECPASQDAFCFASNDYTNSKVVEKLKQSKLLKNNPSLKITAITPGAAAAIMGSTSSPQTFLEGEIAKKKIDPKNLNQEFSYQGKTYKVSDFDKVVGENIENVLLNLSLDDAKQYAQNYMLANSQYLNSSQNPGKRKAVLDNLNEMFGYIYGSKGPEELSKMLECAPEDNLKPIVSVLEHLDKNKKVNKCETLFPGDFKVFKREDGDYYGTGDYLLRRKPDGNYQAVVNVNFVKGMGSVSPDAMMERAKNCLSAVSPYMKGPNGSSLEISILTQDEINKLPRDQRPLPRRITIEEASYGTNAASYAEGVSCAVITHETLHILGLCDEYHEDRPKYGDMWDCRVATKVTSMMRNQEQMFREVFGPGVNCSCTTPTCNAIMTADNLDLKEMYVSQQWFEVLDQDDKVKYCKQISLPATEALIQPDKSIIVTAEEVNSFKIENRYISSTGTSPYYRIDRSELSCSCSPGDFNCIKFKEDTVKKVKNLGITSRCPGSSSLLSYAKPGEIPKTNLKPGVFTLAGTSKRTSLLHPNQFNKILAGNCPGVADSYNECSSFAYKAPPCNIPARCNDDKYYLGSDQ